MIIWVDIDEVIAETLDFVLKFHDYQIAWKPLKREQFSSYYIPNIPGYEHISKEQAVSFFTDGMRYSAEHWGIQPVLWAKEALEQAKNKGTHSTRLQQEVHLFSLQQRNESRTTIQKSLKKLSFATIMIQRSLNLRRKRCVKNTESNSWLMIT